MVWSMRWRKLLEKSAILMWLQGAMATGSSPYTQLPSPAAKRSPRVRFWARKDNKSG